jgi:hypothetical protein
MKLSNKVAESLKEKTVIANTPLVQQDENILKMPIIVESDETIPVLLPPKDNKDPEEPRGFVITVNKLEDGTYSFKSAIEEEKEDSDIDHALADATSAMPTGATL